MMKEVCTPNTHPHPPPLSSKLPATPQPTSHAPGKPGKESTEFTTSRGPITTALSMPHQASKV